jgi:hypothetical protein
LRTTQERVVADDSILILAEEGGEPPHLVADLDGAVVVRLNDDPPQPSTTERQAQDSILADDPGDALRQEIILADDPGDALVGQHHLTLDVDVVEVARNLEREVGLSHDDRLPVLTRLDHVEPPHPVVARVDEPITLIVRHKLPLPTILLAELNHRLFLLRDDVTTLSIW